MFTFVGRSRQIQTTQRKRSAQTKRNVQTADKTIQPTQDLVTSIKKKKNKKKIKSKVEEEYDLFGSKENCRVLYGRQHLRFSVTWRVDPTRQNNQDNKYRAPVDKLFQLDPIDWPNFQEHLKNVYSVEIQQTERKRMEVLMNKAKSTIKEKIYKIYR